MGWGDRRQTEAQPSRKLNFLNYFVGLNLGGALRDPQYLKKSFFLRTENDGVNRKMYKQFL